MQVISSEIKLQFLGGAGTVTGSKYLVEAQNKKILVDCGLFQGLKELRQMNWEKFPLEPSQIDVVLLTHGHLDHCGYLPRLTADGYKGPIIGTAPTLDIARIILEDSALIQEEDAARANKEKFSRHSPARPLYTLKDVKRTIQYFESCETDTWLTLDENIQYRFRYNGHILGSTFLELKISRKIIVFSGDLGRDDDLLMFAPQKPETADVLIMESTYGDRIHPADAEEELILLINEAINAKGTIIIPAFAVERTQTLMYMLGNLKKRKAIPDIPVYLDTPMGHEVLELFLRYPSWHKLSAEDCHDMSRNIEYIRTFQDTENLAKSNIPKIIIAGSGMASGGRVLNHFLQYLPDPSACILLVGYQAEGTRGRALLEGAKTIKLHGKIIPVNARIAMISGLSSHADQSGLLGWLSQLEVEPQQIFLVHGEENARTALKKKIKEIYDWNVAMPRHNQVTNLTDTYSHP